MATMEKAATALAVPDTHVRAAVARLGQPIAGDLQATIQAFSELSAALAQLKINGWDTVPKCKSACWISHGLQVHPAVFMNNCWVMELQGGKLSIEPMWPFVIDLMTSRLPGFQWKVLHEGPDYCEVWMKYGANEHQYKYSIEDAQRQKLVGGAKTNAWSGGNTREMLKAKAVKRCADMIGGGVMSGLPPMLPEVEAAAEPPKALPSAAEVFSSGPADPAIADAPRQLSVVLNVLYGKSYKDGVVPKDEKLKLVGRIYSQMSGAMTMFATWEQVSPGDCRLMLDWLKKKYPDTKLPEGGEAEGEPAALVNTAEVAGGKAAATPAAGGTDAAPPAEEVAVPLEEEAAPPADPLVEAGRNAAEDEDGKFTTVLFLVNRAKKTHANRNWLREVPVGSGRWYFIDSVIGRRLGFKSAPKLYEKVNGENVQAVDAETCRIICREMRADGVE